MSYKRHFDTVAFDVRDNASMLFFARTAADGDIEDYLLLVRPSGDELGDTIYMEINENQLGAQDMIREVQLSGNILTLDLKEPASELDGAARIVISFDDSEQNRNSIRTGAFRVFGNTLTGGRA